MEGRGSFQCLAEGISPVQQGRERTQAFPAWGLCLQLWPVSSELGGVVTVKAPFTSLPTQKAFVLSELSKGATVLCRRGPERHRKFSMLIKFNIPQRQPLPVGLMYASVERLDLGTKKQVLSLGEWVSFVCLQVEFPTAAQNGLQLILLPQPPKSWDYRA